jgi:GT2 family glycosyltransferase
MRTFKAATLADKASPEAAWQNGLAASRAGAHETALLWLDRAHRLAPQDPRITLDLANACLALGAYWAAAEHFGHLAGRYDILPAWLGLLTARRLQGDHAAAAAALTQLLQRHCVPDDPAFGQVAGLVAQAAGAPGWCGLDVAGAVQLGVPPGAKVKIRLNGKPVRLHAMQAPPAGVLAVTAKSTALLGSPLDLNALRRVEGIVSAAEGSLLGWAARPSSPATPPGLTLIDAKGAATAIVFGNILPPDDHAPFARQHTFALNPKALQGFAPPLRITGPDGRDLFGSPIDPGGVEPAPVPASWRGPPVETCPARAGLAIVVPVYRGLEATRECLSALLAAAPAGARVIVVDDATPEPALAAWLDGLAAAKRLTLIRHARNLGFPAAANAGIQAAAGCDVLLLNSDTLVPPGVIEALAEAAYAAADTGSATPFSNDATILTYPRRTGNPMPDAAGATALQTRAAEANGREIVEIPTAVGFCMFMRHDCIEATGLFRSKIFAQGYGEENDWCLRARHAGFRHVAALGAYVAHQGGASFGAGRALAGRNIRILNRLFPGYDALIAEFIKSDPLADARRRFDIARLRAAKGRAKGAVLLISHNHGGGVQRRLAVEMQAVRENGLHPLLLVPAAPDDPENTPFPWDAEVTEGAAGDYPSLRFTLPDEKPALLALLRGENIQYVALHHGLGHHEGVRTLAAELGVPLDIVLHDYASFCPRVNLLSRAAPDAPLRYCGEPNLAGCAACVASCGDETFENLGPERLVARSAGEFAAARRVVAPSADAAQRIARHFPGVRPVVTPWEDDRAPVALRPPGNGRRRIVTIGGIGPAKGFDVLIDCARDARQRGLRLDFIVAGASAEDGPLMEAGIFVTGAYAEGEAAGLVEGLRCDLAFLPSIWPETWCFALSEAWRAGLYAIAFDLGAQSTRIRATGRGAVLPLGLPISRINDVLASWQP